MDGVLTWDGGGREWSAVFSGPAAQLEATAVLAGAQVVERDSPSLDEIFVARVGAAPGAIEED
jgi:hypothetical protein